MSDIPLPPVLWRLWEGNVLALEVRHKPASYFHALDYNPNGSFLLKKYRAFQYDPDEGIIDAQLEWQNADHRSEA